MDNASNNNTLMDALAARHHEENLDFSAQDARLRCVPHTIHLAALKVSDLFPLLFLDNEGSFPASRRDRSDLCR